MTIDERLQFLLESTESLHKNVEKLYEATARHDEQIGKLSEAVHSQSLRISGLLDIVSGLVTIVQSHEQRLNGLEGNKGQES